MLARVMETMLDCRRDSPPGCSSGRRGQVEMLTRAHEWPLLLRLLIQVVRRDDVELSTTVSVKGGALFARCMLDQRACIAQNLYCWLCVVHRFVLLSQNNPSLG